VTFIQRLGAGKVSVNAASKESMPLAASAEVEIGMFRFKYEKPTEYRQVQVRYRNGNAVEGVPTSWDIGKSGFTLIPSKAPSWMDAKFVRFDRLKGVYFLEDWDEDIRKKLLKAEKNLKKRLISLRFIDGESIDGSLISDYDEKKSRFYFVPNDQSGDAVYILIERSSIESITQVNEA